MTITTERRPEDDSIALAPIKAEADLAALRASRNPNHTAEERARAQHAARCSVYKRHKLVISEWHQLHPTTRAKLIREARIGRPC